MRSSRRHYGPISRRVSWSEQSVEGVRLPYIEVYGAVSMEDLAAIYRAWGGVEHRVDSGIRFWRQFSFIRDPHPSPLVRLHNHFLRSFATFYFFLILNVMKRISRQPDRESVSDQFVYWEEKLASSEGDYLGGRVPDIADMLLFGIIQCHCSILVPPIRVLQEDPELARMRAWLSTMQERFADYPHLYSGAYFEPRSAAPLRSTPLEQAAFWFGAAITWTAFPLTIPLVVFLVGRVQRMGVRRFRPGESPTSGKGGESR